MRSIGRWGIAALAAAGAAGLVGCGSTSIEGQAETPTPQAGEPTFDPCSIPDEVLQTIGLDPTSESRDIQGVKQPGWSLCRWNDPDLSFFVTAFATAVPVDSILTNERTTEPTPIALVGREAFTIRETSDKRNEHCDVLVTAGPDTLMLRTSFAKGLPPSESPCPQAIKNAELLEPSLPR